MYPKAFRFVIWTLCKLLGGIMHPICWLVSYRRPSQRYCPKIDNSYLLMSATKLAAMIRNKQVTSETLVQIYIDRVKTVNSVLNAVVQSRFDEALDEARALDTRYRNNEFTAKYLQENKPLFGIPITVKESISVKGMSNMAGRADLEHEKAPKNARVVDLVIEAGAVPILVSNTPELCMNWESYNKVTGLTKNPYDCSKTPGGSSGGEAALLGSAASVIGLGSDIGGSLRLPAMFTQIFGHKPSPRIVSIDGHYPDSLDDLWPEVFVIGPMTRYAEDLPLLLNVICEPEYRQMLNLRQMIPVQQIKFYYMENDANSYITDNVDNDIVQAMRKFVQYLDSNYNIKAEKINIEELQYAAEISLFSLIKIQNVDNIFGDKNAQTRKKVMPELFKYVTFRSKSVLMPILYGVAQKSVSGMSFEQRTEACTEIMNKISQKFQTILGVNGVFLYPTFPSSAHYHYEIFHKLANASYMAIFNSLGMPSTNCPIGLDSKKMPIGIQVISNRYQDRLTLSVAQELEKAFGGWSIPPSSSS